MELVMQEREKVMVQIENLYNEKVLPLEKAYDRFYQCEIESLNLAPKPFILVLGQEGTGKTSFIRHLIGQDFPGMKFNTEFKTPSDTFTALMHSTTNKFTKNDQNENHNFEPGPTDDEPISGHVHCTNPENEFARLLLSQGNEFRDKFQCSMVDCSVLENISIVDTPGIYTNLSQTGDGGGGGGRNYDFIGVIKWLAERADRIILIFDPFALSISEEFAQILHTLQRHERRIRIIVNKVDMLEKSELRRVQGILLWNLGRIMTTTEIPIVNAGAFQSKFFVCETYAEFVQEDMTKLLTDLQSLPEHPALRKLLQSKKRALLAIVHAVILGEMRAQMPKMGALGYSGTVKKLLIKNLKETYTKVCLDHELSWDDLPDIGKIQEMLKTTDFYSFPFLPENFLESSKQFLRRDLPRLHGLAEEEDAREGKSRRIVGGAFTPQSAMVMPHCEVSSMEDVEIV